MKDRNGVELHEGDVVTTGSGVDYVISSNYTVIERNGSPVSRLASELAKKPGPALDMRGVEITVGAHVWYPLGNREYVVKRCYTESVTIEAENTNVGYIVAPSRVIVLP